MASEIKKAAAALRAFALQFAGAHEDFPWGERVVKVAKKVFVFLGRDGDVLSISVKLSDSASVALELPLPNQPPMGWAKRGWVTATFSASARPPRRSPVRVDPRELPRGRTEETSGHDDPIRAEDPLRVTCEAAQTRRARGKHPRPARFVPKRRSSRTG